MELNELLRRMQGYGLEEGEAQVYFHLCRLGPARAAAVAQASTHTRTDTYRLLDRLVEKGFAEKSLERPARYLPRPPEEALRHALDVRRSHVDRLEEERAALAALWPRHWEGAEPARQRFAIHQGRSQINGLLSRMLAGATEEVMLATSADGLARLDGAALRSALRAKAASGVLVRVLAKRGRGGETPLSDLGGGQVRYADLPTFYQAVVVDAREIALFVNAGKGISGAEETVLWLNSSDVVLAQKALFDQAWDQAVSSADAVEGRLPRQVQVLRGRWVRGARLKEMVLGARASILVRASAAEVALWGRQGILDALARRAAQGVAVSLSLPPGVPAVPGTTVVPAEGATGLVALVDGEQALLGLGTEEAPEEARGGEDWAVWSSHPGLAQLLGPQGWGAAATWAPAPVRRARTDQA